MINPGAFLTNIVIGTTSQQARGHIADTIYPTAFKASAGKATGGLVGGDFDAYNADANVGLIALRGIGMAGANYQAAYGVYGAATRVAGTNTTLYGVYGTASGGAANWAGYFLGNVGVRALVSGNSPILNTGSSASAGLFGGSMRMRSSHGTVDAPTATLIGEGIGFYGAVGYGATGFSASSTGGIAFLAAENFTNSAQGTYASIYTTAIGQIARGERMRIDSAGNVGMNFSTMLTWPLTTNYRGFQIGNYGGLVGSTGASDFYIAQNLSLDNTSAWLYASAILEPAGILQLHRGELYFYTAPDGVAGAAATMTPMFTVSNVGVATIVGGLTVSAGAVSLPAASVSPAAVNITQVKWSGGSKAADVGATFVNITATVTEDIDTAAIHSDGVTTFTGATAGTYLVFGRLATTIGDDSATSYMRIAKNGADAGNTQQSIQDTTGYTATYTLTTFTVITVANTDTISLQVKNSSTSLLTTYQDTSLVLVRIA